jgi:hypothetical protein
LMRGRPPSRAHYPRCARCGGTSTTTGPGTRRPRRRSSSAGSDSRGRAPDAVAAAGAVVAPDAASTSLVRGNIGACQETAATGFLGWFPRWFLRNPIASGRKVLAHSGLRWTPSTGNRSSRGRRLRAVSRWECRLHRQVREPQGTLPSCSRFRGRARCRRSGAASRSSSASPRRSPSPRCATGRRPRTTPRSTAGSRTARSSGARARRNPRRSRSKRGC